MRHWHPDPDCPDCGGSGIRMVGVDILDVDYEPCDCESYLVAGVPYWVYEEVEGKGLD